MIDLRSAVAFFHKAKWSELGVTQGINRTLGENTISDSTVGKHLRICIFSTK
jgi:hypothetical protein